MNHKSSFVNPLAANANLETTFASVILDFALARATMRKAKFMKWFRQIASGWTKSWRIVWSDDCPRLRLGFKTPNEAYY